MSEDMVMMDSPEAATWQKVEGWVSRSGRFFGQDKGAESAARYDGCTHRYCDGCHKPIPVRGLTKCVDCRAAQDAERFAAMPRVEWDGKSMIYSQATDQFYRSPGEALDDLDEGESVESLRLVICEPQYPRRLDFDHFADDLPEDCDDLPGELQEAMEAFNAAVAKMEPLSWVPGRNALALMPNDEVK